jgi:hypothetical protein
MEKAKRRGIVSKRGLWLDPDVVRPKKAVTYIAITCTSQGEIGAEIVRYTGSPDGHSWVDFSDGGGFTPIRDKVLEYCEMPDLGKEKRSIK